MSWTLKLKDKIKELTIGELDPLVIKSEGNSIWTTDILINTVWYRLTSSESKHLFQLLDVSGKMDAHTLATIICLVQANPCAAYEGKYCPCT